MELLVELKEMSHNETQNVAATKYDWASIKSDIHTGEQTEEQFYLFFHLSLHFLFFNSPMHPGSFCFDAIATH